VTGSLVTITWRVTADDSPTLLVCCYLRTSSVGAAAEQWTVGVEGQLHEVEVETATGAALVAGWRPDSIDMEPQR
jgi:hypothetical protein